MPWLADQGILLPEMYTTDQCGTETLVYASTLQIPVRHRRECLCHKNQNLEQVPQELIVNVMVILNFRRLDERSQ